MKYIAITLGPITRTIEMAENTRGIWAASYLFSYLGKNIIRHIKDRVFLLPKITEMMFTGSYHGAGLFPDRYIFEAQEGDFKKLKDLVDDTIRDLGQKMAAVVNMPEQDVVEFIKSYFKFYFFEKDFKDIEKKKIKEECEKTLSLLEMQDTIVPQTNDEKAYLNRFFDRVSKSFLTKDAGIDDFKSIVEISSNDKIEDGNQLLPFERYVAIVKADGDSMGKAFEKNMDAEKLSEALLDFNIKSGEIIDRYDGMPVYTGGDDLLFFAPIYNDKTKASIFSLLQELDDQFHDCISLKTNCYDLAKHPTLSFGVSITYYKYPMFEALKMAEDMLYKAKGYGKKKNNILKNNIVFCVQRHSGQTRDVLLHKGNVKTLNKFNSFVDKYVDEDEKILTSVMHGLREKDFLLSLAIKDKDKLNNYFTNNFNESGHQSYHDFFYDVQDLMLTAYTEFLDENRIVQLENSMPESMKTKENDVFVVNPEKAAIETVFNALQFIHLVNLKKQNNDENI